jgi:shikimate dehydrogenase
MERFAVLGQPVNHSLSPQIHRAFGAQLHIDLAYEKIEVAPEAFDATLKDLHAEGWRGLNVTLPHKVAALAACGDATERARLAGAANTLTRTDGGWSGDNTDGDGLVRDLATHRIALRGKRVLLLGAGGAARGALQPLLEQGPAELVISSRTPWVVEKLAAEFKPHGNLRPSTHIALKGDAFDVVINATSAGHQGEAPRLPPGVLSAGGAAYDLNYGKAHAPFGAWARAQGAGTIADGLGMLVEQAAAAFERWHGRRPDTAPVIAALRRT